MVKGMMGSERGGRWQHGRVLGLALVLVGGLLLTGPASADGPQRDSPWPQFKRDGTLSGLAPVNGPYTPVEAWRASAGGPIVRGPVLAADGTVYVGTSNGKVVAFDRDGRRRWTYDLTGTPTFPMVNSAALVVIGTENGYIVGLKPSDGTEDWKLDLRTLPYAGQEVAVRGYPSGSPNYSHLWIGTDSGVIYELSDAGEFKGVRRANGPVRAAVGMTPDGTLVWAGHDRVVYGGHAFGGDKFRFGVDGDVNATPAIGRDSVIYAATSAGNVYAIRSDGTQRWRVRLGDGRPIVSSPVLGPDGTIYVGSEDGRLYALSPADGSVKWTFTTGDRITSTPAVGANGLIYLPSRDGTLYVLTPEGREQSTFRIGRPFDFSSPAIGADGRLYIGGTDDILYVLREGLTATPTPVPAVTATPTVAPTPTPVPLPTDRAAPLPGALYFFETGHNVRGAFLRYFDERGGLEQFGYPRTEEFTEDGLTVQYFQRARFEYHPQFIGTPYEVQLQLLGDIVTAPRRPFPAAAPVPSTDDVRYFPETMHTVRGVFLRYFNEKGGLDRFGFPISEELQEQNNDGTGRSYTVQYFQRARLEHHPELAGTPYEIQLGLLGDQVLRQRGWLP